MSWGIFLNCIKLILSVIMKYNNSASYPKNPPTSKPTPIVGFKTKLVVLILMVLIVSSGSLYYVQVPVTYYGFLGISVFVILVLIFLIIYFTKGAPELFPEETEDAEPDKPSGMNKLNPGLEKILKAEKRYENIQKRSGARSTTTKLINKNVEKRKRRKIGSIPMEESILRERIKLQSKPTKNKKPQKTGKVTTLLCPTCGSKELYYEAGLISGYKYHCKDCDYIGTFVIEKDFKINNSE